MNMTLERTGPIPLYYQVHDKIKKLITDGNYQKGDKFLPERELSERFDVDRGTIRRALDLLIKEEIVYKVHRDKRRGIFINKTPKNIEKKLRSIGYFINQSDPTQTFYSQAFMALQNLSDPCEYRFILGSDRKDDLSSWIKDNDIDALVVSGVVTDSFITKIKSIGIPFIVLGNYNLSTEVNRVVTDGREAMFKICQTVSKLRANSVGLVAGNKTWQITRELVQDLKSGCEKFSLLCKDEHLKFSEEEEGYDNFKTLMKAPDTPDVVVVTEPAFWGVARYIFENKNDKKQWPVLVLYGADRRLAKYDDLISIAISEDYLELANAVIEQLENILVNHSQICEIKRSLKVELL